MPIYHSRELIPNRESVYRVSGNNLVLLPREWTKLYKGVDDVVQQVLHCVLCISLL